MNSRKRNHHFLTDYVYLSPNSTKYVKVFDNLHSKVEHTLTQSSFPEIRIWEDFNAHHQIKLSSSFIIQSGEETYTFVFLNDLQQIVQNPISSSTTLEIRLTSRASSYPINLPAFLLNFNVLIFSDHNLIFVLSPIALNPPWRQFFSIMLHFRKMI